MKVVFDTEFNSLYNPTHMWVIVCRCVETGEVAVFRRLTDDPKEKERFLAYARGVDTWIGHNILECDLPVLYALVDLPRVDVSNVVDTLIISRLVDYSREGGHSIEQYGTELGYAKSTFSDFTRYSEELEARCIIDCEIGNKVYAKYVSIISDPAWQPSISLEQCFQLVVNDLHDNGFGFDTSRATGLLEEVTKELGELDAEILGAFPPKQVLVREFTPKATKYGTISKTSVPRSLWDNISSYEVGVTYPVYREEVFNPSSHKQLISILTEAGWKPENKTSTHIDTEREISQLKRKRDRTEAEYKQLDDLTLKLNKLKITGWKVDEINLSTLPESAPAPARLLAKRILLEARRRSLTEWLGLVKEDGRIHGKFVGIGAWTHRMAHQNPNTANIPREFKEDGSIKLLGRELRELWWAPPRRLLVGVDAEGIQLRIFAHLIDDLEFTEALVKGKKDAKTDPHSLNQRILGDVCKTRQSAKRFIYALLLGAGLWKLAQILGCSEAEAREALDRLLRRYEGWAYLKKEVIPKDARRGYFIGLDGRHVPILGKSKSEREHLAMSGYLQSGEAIVIKRAAVEVARTLEREKRLGQWKFVNIVHDELQSETKHDMAFALQVAQIKANAIRNAGISLGLKCPLAGSYKNDDTKKFTIGKTWYDTH